MRSASLLLLAIFCMSMACNKSTGNNNSNDNNNKVQKCPEDVICTQMFAMVAVSVLDNKGKSVVLDKVETTRKSTGTVVSPQQQMGDGRYIVLDDNYVKNIQNSSDEFVFKGYLNNKVVVEDTYTISADCCHIKKQSGASELTVK